MATMIKLDLPGGALPVYRAEPAGEPRGALIVIHEIWGLVDQIKDVADRFAAEGYLVVAPDLLSGVGVAPEIGEELQALVFNVDEATRNAAQPIMREKLAPARSPEYGAWAVAALRKVVDYLVVQPGIGGRIGVTGFCFGGSYSFALTAADPRIRAAVPFYGQPPQTAQIGDISCPILAFYGDQDVNLMQTLPAVTASMTDAGIAFASQVYPGARHAFFNDRNPATYDSDAAADAWQRTTGFLAEALAASPTA